MIPIRDENPTFSTPVVTIALIAINIIVFFTEPVLGGSAHAQAFVFPDSAVPLIGASGAIAGILGAYILMFPRARVRNLIFLFIFITTIELPAYVVIGLWFVLQLL